MVPVRSQNKPNVYLACVLAWLIPGAGHWMLGMKPRAVIIFITVVLTFLLGVLLGGVYVLGPSLSKFAFVCQLCSGLPGIVGALLRPESIVESTGRGVDLGQIYTGIAGGLNLLCVLDILARTEQPASRTE